MASGITHMLLAREVMDHIDGDYQPAIKARLRKNSGFYLLGSIAPDLPYMVGETVAHGQTDYANKFHYEKTNQIPIEAFKYIQDRVNAGMSEKDLRPYFAFFVGYCSHVVGDGIVHPFVRDKVGDYSKEGVPALHRKLEMRLDVYGCKKILETELNITEIHDDLRDIEKDDEVKYKVYDLFADLIKKVYSKEATRFQIESWYEVTHTAFDVSTNDFPQWYKKIVGDLGFSHFNYDSITDQESADINLGLPCDAQEKGLTENFRRTANVNYFDDVIPQFYKTYSKVLVDAYKVCFENMPIKQFDFPAINLDIGRLLGKEVLTEMPHYWS